MIFNDRRILKKPAKKEIWVLNDNPLKNTYREFSYDCSCKVFDDGGPVHDVSKIAMHTEWDFSGPYDPEFPTRVLKYDDFTVFRYDPNDGSTYWDQLWKTLAFSPPPSGELLEWLKANATPQ